MLHKEFAELFENPSKEYSPAPLWFWYGKLDKKELARQIDEMVDKGVYNAFMHPRAYLVTQYLEDEWWGVVSFVIEYSKKKGFHPWLYDEYAWPSGTCGSTFKYSCQKPSRVLAEGECNMAKGLRYEIVNSNDISGYRYSISNDKPVAIVKYKKDELGKVADDSLELLSAEEFAGISEAVGSYEVMLFYKYIIPTAVDYLNKETIETFIRYTHEEYKKRYGEYFGTLIPGIFFDEIFNAADKIVWTDKFSEEFAGRMGYDIRKYLPLLVMDGNGRTREVRKDYYSVVTALYEEAFFEAIGNWCSENKLLLTGHTEEDLKLHPLRQGNYFKTMRHLDIPGGDCHDYRYKYPRRITPVEPKGAVSTGRLNNRKRLMSEAMGGGGWATSLQEFKRGINVLAAMGINFFVLHGFYSETDHQGSQADWPTSFFFQNPYWKNFKVFSDYISRLSFMGTYGKPVVNVGLLYPIGHIYERFADGKATKEGERIADIYNTILETLLNNQIDTDIIDEESIIRADAVAGKLKVGEEEFSIIIIPDAEGIKQEVLLKLEEFEKNGGTVMLYRCGEKRLSNSFSKGRTIENIEEELVDCVKSALTPDLEIIEGDKKDIFYYHRTFQNTDYYLIVNSRDEKAEITCKLKGRGIPQIFNIESGKCSKTGFYNADKDFTTVKLGLNEDEALFVVFDTGETSVIGSDIKESQCETRILSDWTVVPVKADYIDNIPEGSDIRIEIPAALFSSDLNNDETLIRIQNKKGEKGNCGRHLSLWKASWITRRPTWSDESCEENLYFRKTFEIKDKVISARICIAAVNVYELYVNGVKICTGEGWREPSEIDIGEYLRQGVNLLAVKVINNTPVQGRNMLETEYFNPDTLTSLLLEGYIETNADQIQIKTDDSWITCSDHNPGWEALSLNAEKTAISINIKGITFPWDNNNKKEWIHAWERGKPPMQPWRRLSLFGKDVAFPVKIKYKFKLPSGTVKVFKPVVAGEFSASIDGRNIQSYEWEKGFVDIDSVSKVQVLEIEVHAENFESGLTEPVNIMLTKTNSILEDWQERGLEYYSGYMLYKTNIELDSISGLKSYILDLGAVNFHSEVWVNGKKAGVRLWKPYSFDISSYLKEGTNVIAIAVSNLAANKMRISLLDEGCAMGWNRYWYEENIDRDSQNLKSGLFGPVKLIESKLDK